PSGRNCLLPAASSCFAWREATQTRTTDGSSKHWIVERIGPGTSRSSPTAGSECERYPPFRRPEVQDREGAKEASHDRARALQATRRGHSESAERLNEDRRTEPAPTREGVSLSCRGGRGGRRCGREVWFVTLTENVRTWLLGRVNEPTAIEKLK